MCLHIDLFLCFASAGPEAARVQTSSSTAEVVDGYQTRNHFMWKTEGFRPDEKKHQIARKTEAESIFVSRLPRGCLSTMSSVRLTARGTEGPLYVP
jgi:hypothetical protein